ncbi:hypothetical protein NACSLCCMFF_120005 [Tenacibaculum maritimum]|uniref:hypothetical protein n=1 Tax=Tenacibaculum maritimum TaxID=107401 RepID=UPI0012E40670|nr:hypothetical protein [Tenacibaculum maritimum]CAA0158191.1 hypothetical protein NACSLCCMFF_120005 [Tenacibaculum maritimum]
MKILYYIKYLFFLLLIFLLGVQGTYSKTELVLVQKEVSFSIEKDQSFQSLEKELQPNIGFLKEKAMFVTVQYSHTVNSYNLSKGHLCEVAKEGERGLLSVFKSNLKNRIAKESNMTLRYVDDELSAIISNGKKLNLPEKEIEDIIFNGCRNSKKFTKDELISQTNFWKKVKDKGYPTSLFKTLNEYEKFGEAVKGLAKKWGLPENSIFVQGSSLKVSDISKIGDLDIAIKVDINTFDNLVAKFKKAARDVKIKNRIGNNGKIGEGDMFSPDVLTRQSFTTNAYTEIEKAFGGINFTQKFGVEKLQISIIKESGKLDVSPYLLVK